MSCLGTRSVHSSEKLARQLESHGLPFRLLNALHHEKEAAIVAAAGGKGKITIATNMAGRGTDIKLDPDVVALGGLHVIATELHESKRIDRQLFGRCARQGDPGSTQTFISLDDELFCRFLPRFLKPLLTTTMAMRLPGTAQLIKKAFSFAQYEAQRIAFRQRTQVLQADTWLEETLSFGKPD